MKLHEILSDGLSIRAYSSGTYALVKSPSKDLRKGYLLGLEEGATFGLRVSGGSNLYAVVPSVRGANPQTGLPEEGSLRVMGRGTMCPRNHGMLKGDGYCPVCEHNWPSTNYLQVSETAELKGWRVSKDSVSPFVFTSDMSKDAASSLILTDPGCSLMLYVYKGPTVGPYYAPCYSQPQFPHLGGISWDCTMVSGPVALLNDVAVGGAAPVDVADSEQWAIDKYPETPSVVEIHLVPLEEALAIQAKESAPSGPFAGMPR